MTQKIAVAVIHGMGTQKPDFADAMKYQLEERCRHACGKDIIIRSIYWADLLDAKEAELMRRLKTGGSLWYEAFRWFLINSVSDAFAYQITPGNRQVYDAIHRRFGRALRGLAHDAGADAPLCVIAHSLGSVISSNYMYDLQHDRPHKPLIKKNLRRVMSKPPTPLELGKTFALFYTMGSPIALWSLRYFKYGTPIHVPDKHFKRLYPQVAGEWINFYDAADVISAPIKTLNDAYGLAVSEDREVKVGNELLALTPLSHVYYWTDEDVLNPIADKLIKVWQAVNP